MEDLGAGQKSIKSPLNLDGDLYEISYVKSKKKRGVFSGVCKKLSGTPLTLFCRSIAWQALLSVYKLFFLFRSSFLSVSTFFLFISSFVIHKLICYL